MTGEITTRQQKGTNSGGCRMSDIAQAVGYPTQALRIRRSCAASRRAELFCMKVMVGYLLFPARLSWWVKP
ncbi:hypothetical protein Q669_21450 [Labrenzia sp. C1B10]|nr:hypothetical protein Q669_21450 [Labrenzia sp. C1B10]ERS01566.1 hypothetical protein Q675_05565 [Labrenzia sp. C1B70]